MDVKLISLNRKRPHLSGFVVQAGRHLLIMMLLTVLVSGMIIGNIFLKNNQELYIGVSEIFQNHISVLTGQTFSNTFLQMLIINASCVGILFFFGLSALGVPVPIIVTLIKGISIGAFSSFMYLEYSLKGFGYCMLVFYPVQIIDCMIALKAGKESFIMSSAILKNITEKKDNRTEEYSVRSYLIKFIIFILVQLISSLISTLLTTYLVPLLNF